MNFTLGLAKAGTVRGIALDPMRVTPGLIGNKVLRNPGAASAVLSATLQAAADYLQALAREGQATLSDGWLQLTTGQPAQAWTYIAARLAQGLEPHGGVATPVELTEISSGAPLTILVTEVP